MEILSPRAFDVFLTSSVGVVAAAWLVYDAINLVRARHADSNDPKVRDRRFGYVIGMIIGVVGLVGVVHHYL
jgi:hypothetical protein